jgi:hypothetical protein
VLAAALSADADNLLTENARLFPRGWMTDHGIRLLTAGDLLARLTKQFPDEMRSTHESTVRHPRKSDTEVLATLEAIVGKHAADTVRRLVTRIEERPEDRADGEGWIRSLEA